MKDDDRVVTFSVPLWDKETRTKINTLKNIAKSSRYTFSQLICQAISMRINSWKEENES